MVSQGNNLYRNYPKNGSVVFDDIQEHIDNNDFPQIPIGTIGGIDEWYIEMRTNDEDNYICPFIFCPEKPDLFIKVYASILKKDGYSSYQKETRTNLESLYGVKGFRIDIDELLDEKNGYLNDDGGLSIEYGIHVESILGDDGIWKFNFYDELFDCQDMRNMIIFMHGEYFVNYLYCHKQLLSFQSKLFNSKSNRNQTIDVSSDIDYGTVEQCLQTAHGIRLQDLSGQELFAIIGIARRYSLSNVIHYCEQQFIESDLESFGVWFDWAVYYNLNRLLAKLMRGFESVEELKEILEDDVDIDEMSGEAMKQCVKYIFENSN